MSTVHAGRPPPASCMPGHVRLRILCSNASLVHPVYSPMQEDGVRWLVMRHCAMRWKCVGLHTQFPVFFYFFSMLVQSAVRISLRHRMVPPGSHGCKRVGVPAWALIFSTIGRFIWAGPATSVSSVGDFLLCRNLRLSLRVCCSALFWDCVFPRVYNAAGLELSRAAVYFLNGSSASICASWCASGMRVIVRLFSCHSVNGFRELPAFIIVCVRSRTL
jgi:hypothetical protein